MVPQDVQVTGLRRGGWVQAPRLSDDLTPAGLIQAGPCNSGREEDTMANRVSMLYNRMKARVAREDGQDLVEYGLVVALIAFTVIAGLESVSTDISMIYSAIVSTVATSS